LRVSVSTPSSNTDKRSGVPVAGGDVMFYSLCLTLPLTIVP
jgi:hypothetical protein